MLVLPRMMIIEDFTEYVKDRNRDIIDASAGIGVASIESQDLNVGQEKVSFPCDVVHKVDIPETSDACTGTVEDRNRYVIDVSAGVGSSFINSVDLSGEAGNQEKEYVQCGDSIHKLDVPETMVACTEDANDQNRNAIDTSAGGRPSINSMDQSGEAGNDG